VASRVFDIGVNIGPVTASKWLQRCLNVLTDMVLYVDGDIGPMTLNALHVYLNRRKAQDGENTLIKAITGIQVCHYINITEKRPANRSFIYGLLRNRT
jgi:lysozyme family protein